MRVEISVQGESRTVELAEVLGFLKENQIVVSLFSGEEFIFQIEKEEASWIEQVIQEGAFIVVDKESESILWNFKTKELSLIEFEGATLK